MPTKLAIGAAAIYFLFVSTSYRSTQTALANMRSYTSNVIESMASGLISVDPDRDTPKRLNDYVTFFRDDLTAATVDEESFHLGFGPAGIKSLRRGGDKQNDCADVR
mgnify:CR=1 FL=1